METILLKSPLSTSVGTKADLGNTNVVRDLEKVQLESDFSMCHMRVCVASERNPSVTHLTGHREDISTKQSTVCSVRAQTLDIF